MKQQRFPAFQSRDFRLWWIGQFISSTGSMMQLVAINWHVYSLTHSAFALGLVGFFQFLPYLVFGLPAGVIADAYNRKLVNLVAQVFLALLSLALATLTFIHTITPVAIYVIVFLYTATFTFDLPSRYAFTPQLVKEEHVTNAVSLYVFLRQTAGMIGPAIGGFLIAFIGVGSIYLMNALSFVPIVLILLAITIPGNGGVTAVSLASFTQAFHFVRRSTLVWSTMLLDFFSTIFGEANTLLPIFAQDILHVGPQGLGILYSAFSIGEVLAGSVVSHQKVPRHQGKILLAAVGFYGMCIIIFGVSKLFFLSCLALLLAGVGDGISSLLRNIIRQAATPNELLGRTSAINMMFFMGGPQLGEFEAGAVAAWVGVPLSVVIGGIGTLIIVAWVAAKLPLLRNYEN